MRIAEGGLSVGDIVYGPFPGKGDDARQRVWRDGRYLMVEASGEVPRIDWNEPADGGRDRVIWVRVERTGGPGGWLRDPEGFACMGERPDEDEGC